MQLLCNNYILMKICIFGGLGNQLFKFMSAINFIQNISPGERLHVDLSWYREPAHLSKTKSRNFDLFEFPNVRKACEVSTPLRPLLYQMVMKVPDLPVSTQALLGYVTDKNIKEVSRKFHFHTLIGDFEDISLLPNPGLVLELLQFPHMESLEPLRLNLILESQMQNVVAVHVRRGDYLNFQNTYPILGKNYYIEAKKYIEKQLQNPSYWLFSDDPQLAFKDLKEVFEFSEIVSEQSGCSTVETLELMSKCNGLITANSTFSWWAAYIATLKNKFIPIVAPRHYKHFHHIDSYSSNLHVPGWTIREI